MAETAGVSKSSVSRQAGERLKELAERRLDDRDYLIVYVDGIQFGGHHPNGGTRHDTDPTGVMTEQDKFERTLVALSCSGPGLRELPLPARTSTWPPAVFSAATRSTASNWTSKIWTSRNGADVIALEKVRHEPLTRHIEAVDVTTYRSAEEGCSKAQSAMIWRFALGRNPEFPPKDIGVRPDPGDVARQLPAAMVDFRLVPDRSVHVGNQTLVQL